jgi:hypothetical protein
MPRKNPNAGVLFGTHIAVKKMENMGYLGNYRNLEQTAAAVIQAQLPVQLRARGGAAGRGACHLPSGCDSPFRLRPNDAVPSRLSALLAALLFAASGAVQAKTIDALSPSFFDVNKAIGSAADGDIVIVPAGTATWSDQLVITKAITLMGKTTTDSVAGTSQDNTTITSNTSAGSLIQLNTCSPASTCGGKTYRITGITFLDAQASNGKRIIGIGGQSNQARVDHCQFKLKYSNVILVTGGVYGVADHNVISVAGGQPFKADNGNAGSSENTGHAVWTLPAEWSSGHFFFIEDNHVTGGGTNVRGMYDVTIGGKAVIRNNKIFNFVPSAAHGTEGGQGVRGNRATIIYGNTINNPISSRGGGTRSGGILFYNNTWIGKPASPAHFGLDYFREYTSFAGGSWKGANGANPWDINETDGTATSTIGTGGYNAGHSSHIYASGTCESGSDQSLKSGGTPNWPADKWKNFQVRRVSDGKLSLIQGNSADTLTLNGSCINGGCTATNPKDSTWWKNGDQYEIRRVLVALDQSGRGQGDLLSGTNPTPVAWPHQQLEPCYSWNNRNPGGGHVDLGGAVNANSIVLNRDYYNEVAGGQQTSSSSPFNGTTGVGWGTLAQRPTSGVGGTDITGVTTNPPGTAYWATDVASVNGSTEKGALYVWRGNAWVLYYQPYTYPHPLTRELAPPSNLTIVP